MAENNNYKNIDEFLSKTKIPYSKSKEDVWSFISEKIDSSKPSIKRIQPGRKKVFLYSAAAVVFALLSITIFLRLYTSKLSAPKGQHLQAVLPDGSNVTLNAGTTLTFNPYWWRFSRVVKLNGEAYFEVKKGKKFLVQSENGKTEVLGTSFNIFARETTYKVHCFSGKVKVSSPSGKSEILVKNESAELSGKEMIKSVSTHTNNDASAWIENRFVFTSAPVQEVFDELERQFDIKIITDSNLSDLYTGNFKRGESVEKILNIICKPLNLTYSKENLNTYKIKKE
jgi:transmembrane sensor